LKTTNKVLQTEQLKAGLSCKAWWWCTSCT